MSVGLALPLGAVPVPCQGRGARKRRLCSGKLVCPVPPLRDQTCGWLRAVPGSQEPLRWGRTELSFWLLRGAVGTLPPRGAGAALGRSCKVPGDCVEGGKSGRGLGHALLTGLGGA